MKNKKSLIILTLILAIVLTLLITYAYKTTNQPITSSPNLSTKPVEQTKGTELEKQEKLELEEIKRKMDNINNETFQTDEEEDCDEESIEATEDYTQEVIEGKSKSSEGLVLEKNNSKLKVEFYQGSYKWISEVEIDNNTNLSFISSATGETEKASLSDIEVQDRVIVKSADNKIIDEKFKAEGIYVYR
jgi:heme/copper-type cytochrome/quinol oxidase subunit 2